MNLVELDKYDLTWHQKVAYLGTRFLEKPQAPTELEHIFEPGEYVREMKIPAGVFFIGRPHRFGHEVQFLSGTVKMVVPDGHFWVAAPYSIHTRPGHITVLETVTEVVLRTRHPNPDECRDVELMESLIFHAPEEMKRVAKSVEQRIRSLT